MTSVVSRAKVEPKETPPAHGQAAPDTGYAWVILAVVLLACVAVALNQFKVPPLVPVLMDAFQIDLGQTGLLMSVFSLIALILAVPSGFLVERLGPKITGLIAMAFLTAGAAWGAVAEDFSVLFGSRILEGVGLGLIAITAPVVIARWFPRERRGLPMGIWSTWVGIGSVAMLNLAPALDAAAGWRAVWWAGAAFALVALVLYGLLLRPPPATDHPATISHHPSPTRAVLANSSLWYLALAFGCFNLVFIGFFTFFPAFLAEERQYSLAQAAFITSLITLLGIASGPLAGWLSDRFATRRVFIAVPLLVFAILMIWPFQATGWTLYAVVLLFGSVSGGTPAVAFATVPEVVGEPRLAGMGMAAVSMGATLGFVIGPPIFGILVERFGWAGAGYLLIPVSLLGFAAAWLVRVR